MRVVVVVAVVALAGCNQVFDIRSTDTVSVDDDRDGTPDLGYRPTGCPAPIAR